MSHEDRMREIGFWALPRRESPEYQTVIEKLKSLSTPESDREVRKIYDEAIALVNLQQMNGASLPMDKSIREYSREYNNRVLNHSLHDMPTSFNIVEAFHRFLPRSATFRIRKEKDYLISFVDYLDFFTGQDLTPNLSGLKEFYEEGVVYSFNGTHDVDEIFFKCEGTNRFCVAGVSLVRMGSEISVIMLAGQECDLVAETKLLREEADFKSLPHKAHISPAPDLKLEAVPLVNDARLWRTVVLSRIDLEAGSIDIRHVAKDCGNHYRIVTDDVAGVLNGKGEFLNGVPEETIQNLMEKIAEYQPLFEFVKVCLHIPQYVQEKDDSVSIERHPTELRLAKRNKKLEKAIKLCPPSERVYYREVSTVSEGLDAGFERKSIFSPHIKVETSGFWKTLPFGAIGQGKAGQPIHGRTWVEKTLSWVEQDRANTTLTVTQRTPVVTGQDPGVIYVMRCAAHGKDIFKIGLSRRNAEDRATELTSSTSAPDQFLVVDDWETGDCGQAEKIIHEMLKDYRPNPKREFFKAPYKVIHKVVLEVLEELR